MAAAPAAGHAWTHGPACAHRLVEIPDGFAVPAFDANGSRVGPIIFDAGAFSAGDDATRQLAQSIEPLEFAAAFACWPMSRKARRCRFCGRSSPDRSPTCTCSCMCWPTRLRTSRFWCSPRGTMPLPCPPVTGSPASASSPRHRLQISAPAMTGEYTLRVGWYSTARHGRLAVDCPDNSCPLTTLFLPF